MSSLVVGDGADPATTQGPLINEAGASHLKGSPVCSSGPPRLLLIFLPPSLCASGQEGFGTCGGRNGEGCLGGRRRLSGGSWAQFLPAHGVDRRHPQHGRQYLCHNATYRGGCHSHPQLLPAVVSLTPTAAAQVCSSEIFGPVAPVLRFTNEANAISMANDTRAGLVSYVYSRDIGRVWRVAEVSRVMRLVAASRRILPCVPTMQAFRILCLTLPCRQALQTGMVGVNTGIISTEVAPFGGVKESGIGREGSMCAHGSSSAPVPSPRAEAVDPFPALSPCRPVARPLHRSFILSNDLPLCRPAALSISPSFPGAYRVVDLPNVPRCPLLTRYCPAEQLRTRRVHEPQVHLPGPWGASVMPCLESASAQGGWATAAASSVQRARGQTRTCSDAV